MESRVGSAQEVSGDAFTWRFRLAVCSLLLTVMAVLQTPGRIVSDTKIDLVVDPGAFLSRSLSLWDPNGAFGQVQNQAYGYLFPMGPFFWLGDAIGFEPWLIQRLWWALIFVVAFLGFVALARELDIGTSWVQIAGGFAYALSPRMLSIIGPSSIEVWPAAVAPWVLLPLVVGSSRRSPAAMAALSALAVACVGGVNAAATFAVIPLGVLWLLMSAPGTRRRVMMIAWPLFVLMGTLWWLVPLFILGQYSPPFLDFIENASLTTFAANPLDALRGTTNWTPYLSGSSVAGAQFITNTVLICNVVVVATLGIVGIARRDNPHGRYLFVGLLVGLVLVTLGHTTSLGGIAAPQLQSLLDGALAPLRNTHKFDVVVRLVLVLGFTHLVSVALRTHLERRRGDSTFAWTPALGVVVLAFVGLAGAVSPAWAGNLANRGSFAEVPDYWKSASNWLNKNSEGRGALLAPASSFANYNWGSINDEILQPLARTPWTVRNTIPLAPAGHIGTLDAIESRFTDVRGSEALADYLAHSGVGYIVVRNDLSAATDVLDPEIVYNTLRQTPGLEQVAAFGPLVGGDAKVESEDGEEVFIDRGLQSRHRAIEIFEVEGATRVRAQPSSSAPVVVGAPDSQLSLIEAGMLSSPSVIFAHDVEAPDRPSELILTDGQRRQEAAFGRAHNNRSSSFALTESFVADRPVNDYSLSEGDRWLSVPEMQGARAVTASTAGSWIDTPQAIDKSQQPWSAFDGDPLTAWTASAEDFGQRSWVEIEFDEPVDVSETTVTLDRDVLESAQLTVHTDEERVPIRAVGDTPTAVTGLSRPTTTMRVSGVSTRDDLLSISDIDIEGVDVSRPLGLPVLSADWGTPQRILLADDNGYQPGCFDVDGFLRCAAGLDSWGEDGRTLDRILTLPRARVYPAQLAVAPIGGPALDRLIQSDQLADVAASSQVVRSARATAFNAIDGNLSTAWVADPDDADPRLTLSWLAEEEISSIRLRTTSPTAASRPTEVTLAFADGSREQVELSSTGLGEFDPVTTDSVEIRIDDVERVRSVNSGGGGGPLPVGITEITIGETDLFPRVLSNEEEDLGCGSGPDVSVNGETYETAVNASPQDLTTDDRLDARICGLSSVALEAGENRVTLTGNDEFRPLDLALGSGPEDDPAETGVRLERWTTTERAVELDDPSGPQIMAVTENTNPGWEATTGGARSVVVNGWQQGWAVDADADDVVRWEFAPNSAYRLALVAGAVSFVLLLVAAAFLLVRGQTTTHRPDSVRHGRRWTVLAATLTAGVALALGGAAGLGLVAAGAFLAVVVRRRVDPALLAGALVGVAGLAAATRPWAGTSPWFGESVWFQLAIMCALGSMAASVFGWKYRRNSLIGRSTNR